jgi:hypothetical protein
LYTLRSAPCFADGSLAQYDNVIQVTLQSLLNIDLNASVAALTQAFLPVSAGGLGIRMATDLALPAFMSSITGTNDLVKQLLPMRFHDFSAVDEPVYCSAKDEWLALTQCDSIPCSAKQVAWDEPLYKLKAVRLLSAAPSQSDRARLIAVSAPHAGDFLMALPCSSLGTRLDNTSFRIAVALRLGLPVSSQYMCICGTAADSYGAHALVCHKTDGRRMRHNTVNDLLKRALASADIPARLEPSCLSRDDGKRPDGLTLMPWARGKCLVWDFTCTHTLAASFINRAVLGQSIVATDAETRKAAKYSSLAANYFFVPIAIETFGAVGLEASAFFSDLGRRLHYATHEPRAYTFLMQRISVAVQRGNAACVIGSVPPCARWDDLFYI